jgi:hypothetical protein
LEVERQADVRGEELADEFGRAFSQVVLVDSKQNAIHRFIDRSRTSAEHAIGAPEKCWSGRAAAWRAIAEVRCSAALRNTRLGNGGA